MSLITATNIGKSYGPVDIFTGLNFSIPQQARIALVGSNGIGKTTLLRVLQGMEEPSEGTIQRARSLRMGYLPQEARFVDTEHSLWEECLEAFADLRAAQLELERLEKLMEDEGQAEAALELYGRRQMDFDRRGGYVYEERARMALPGWASSRQICSARLANCLAGSAPALCWPACCWKNRISCCWTNQPIIWISRRSNGWNHI